MRELRLHPDDVHIGWSHIILSPQLAEPTFICRLQFNESPTTGNPLVPRYDLVNVWALQSTDPALLCSSAGDWITGQVINVDGGWLLRH
jgi:hypothetical protein